MEDKKFVNNADNESGRAGSLRQRAEVIFSKRKTKDRQPKSEEEVRALLHELQVHQIELEMQNEELERTRLEAEKLRDRYFDLYNFAPAGYFTFDENGAIREVNLAGAELLGLEREKLIARRFQVFVMPEHVHLFNGFCKELFETKIRQTCEIRLLRDDMPSSIVLVDGIYLSNGERNSRQIRATVLDITERRNVEAERETLILELKAALDRVKLLSGLLPICSYCKKIRNDKGYWEQLESYITNHSDALFSHGMCPECEKKAYEDLDEFKKKWKDLE